MAGRQQLSCMKTSYCVKNVSYLYDHFSRLKGLSWVVVIACPAVKLLKINPTSTLFFLRYTARGNSPSLYKLILTNFIKIAVSDSTITQSQEVLFFSIYSQWLKFPFNNSKVCVHFNHEQDNNNVNPNYALLLLSLHP